MNEWNTGGGGGGKKLVIFGGIRNALSDPRPSRARIMRWSAPVTLQALAGRRRMSSPMQVNRSRSMDELRARGHDFHVAANYNYSASTSDVYRDDSPDARNVGEYASIRNELDTAYHGIYTPERQRLQDRLVDALLSTGECQAHPWLLYTAGAMGAGKSHVVHWMWQQGHFPLDQIVHIDADVFKTAMPEWAGYAHAHRPTSPAPRQSQTQAIPHLAT